MNPLLLRKEAERLHITMGVFPEAASLSFGLPFDWAELALYSTVTGFPPESNPNPVLLELASAVTSKLHANTPGLQIGRPYYALLPSPTGTPKLACALSIEFVGLNPYSSHFPEPVTLAALALRDLGVRPIDQQQ